MNLNMFHNIYEKSLSENQKNIHFWEEYLRNLNALDLKGFSEKLTVPVLVPVGNRVLFRGELKHTNEVTVALGADYFAKCSTHQAEVLRQHRINDAKIKLELLMKEREYLENHLLFSKQNLSEDAGHDIIEVFTEAEDKIWRKQHRERVRQHKQNKNKSDNSLKTEMTDEELWNRLEELELQEEIKNELSGNDNITDTFKSDKSMKPEAAADYLDSDDDDQDMDDQNNVKDLNNQNNNSQDIDNKDDQKHDSAGGANGNHSDCEDDNDNNDSSDDDDDDYDDDNSDIEEVFTYNPREIIFDEDEIQAEQIDNEIYMVEENARRDFLPKESPKLELLDEIIERHKYVVRTLSKMARKERTQCESSDDLFERLNELEQFEQYEDEAMRLEDMIYDAFDDDEDEEEEVSDPIYKYKPKKLVSFADDDGNVVLELTFRHSDNEPNYKPYDPKKGITKPSDIYEAFSSSGPGETTSILKKTNYTAPPQESEPKSILNEEENDDGTEGQNTNVNTVVIKDVTERVDHNDNSLNNTERPMSLFKKKRQQKSKES